MGPLVLFDQYNKLQKRTGARESGIVPFQRGGLMQIDTITEQIDSKLRNLDQQLANLQAARKQVNDPNAQYVLDQDLKTLLETRAKLIKSRDLAGRVHQLRQQTEPDARDTRYRKLGLALMIFSGVAMAGVLAGYFWLR